MTLPELSERSEAPGSEEVASELPGENLEETHLLGLEDQSVSTKMDASPRDSVGGDLACEPFPQPKVKNWRAKPHPEAFRLHTARLRVLRSAEHDLSALTASLYVHQRKPFLLQMLHRCEEAIESSLVAALASFDLSTPAGEHVLDRSDSPLSGQHATVQLAAPLLSASGEEPRLKGVQEALTRHSRLIEEFDAAHSLIFYPARNAKTHPKKGEPPTKRFLALLLRITQAETEDEHRDCQAEVTRYREETREFVAAVLSSLNARGVDRPSRPGKPKSSDKAVAPSVLNGGAILTKSKQAHVEPPDSMDDGLPELVGTDRAIKRIYECLRLLQSRCRKRVRGEFQKSERLQMRNDTLSHVDSYLGFLRLALLKGNSLANHPLGLTLPALDAVHRSLKELVVAAFYHQAAYKGGKHRLQYPASESATRPLIADNDVCATYGALTDWLKSRQGYDALKDLPADFDPRLSWCKGIHDRLCYPHRKYVRGESKHPVYDLVERLYRNGCKRQESSEKDVSAGLDSTWRTGTKGRRAPNPEAVQRALVEDTRRLLEEAILPGVNAIYALLREAF